MKRLLVPGIALVAMVAALAASGFIPAGQVPPDSSSTSSARASLVCAALTSVAAEWQTVGVSSGGELRAGEFGMKLTEESVALLDLKGSENPLRVTSPRDDTFSALDWVRTADGPERGMSTTACVSPTASTWYAGATLSASASADLILYNADTSDTVVDVTVFDVNGQVTTPGFRGITVPALGRYSVPLTVLPTSPEPVSDQPVAIHVQASTGRVASFLRQRLWGDKSKPLSAEWIPATVEPAGQVLIPGIPLGEGQRTLTVLNDSDTPATLTVEFLGPDGISFPGVGDLEVEPHATLNLDLAAPLGGEGGSLRVTSSGPEITAGMALTSSDTAKKADMAFLAAGSPIGQAGIWALPITDEDTVQVQFANPTDQPAQVSLTLSDTPDGEAETASVAVPAQSTLVRQLMPRGFTVLRLRTDALELQAAAVVAGKVGTLAGMTVIPLHSDESAGAAPQVVLDYSVGS
ncbi:MAG: DUF5719 family protein [Propionibacteriaceae bacterium]|jgi:hypothetical protein|nr:DUF5719 family protein [Propionibacteriaceae bacterium]